MDERRATVRPGIGPWRSDGETGTVEGFEPFPDECVAGSVADRFFAMADRHTDRVALSSPAGTWTYGQLRDAVLRRAAGIRTRLGAEGGEPVAIAVAHDGPLVIAILAVITAGHVVVVLDPSAPPAHTEHALAETGARLVVHDAHHAAWVAERVPARDGGPTVVALDDLDDPDGDTAGLPAPATASSPLMLAFTSGTSGASKAAVITHGVLLNLVRGATNALGIGPDDRMPMLFPTSLAVAAYPMFLPLLNGGALATLDVRSVGLAPVADFLEQERITLVYMAPTVVRFLVDALADRSFPDMRLVALGGELVDRDIFATTADLFGPSHMANGYGTTETGVITLWVESADLRDQPDGPVPVGYPVPDVEIVILDDAAKPLPRGESGEIAVLSPYVFAGYWKHPELSSLVLSRDPRGRESWRCYRTGDFGRLDENGALVVLGRLDTRVKVRGRPVVLGDVEAAVQQLDGVVDAAVVANDRDGIVELVAYVVGSAEHPLDAQALRGALLEEHETYRVPSRWVQLAEMPRLPNGKVDRRRLPPAGAAPDQPSASGPRPVPDEDSHDRPDLRRRVQAIWSRLFHGLEVGLDDDFVLLGGDSMMAAEMLLVIERELGVTVPMGELVHARTVRSLTESLVRIRHESSVTTTVACVNEGDPNRPRLWFVHDLQGSAYRIRHLAEALGQDQPVWSFESPLLAGEPNQFTQLSTFAARYVLDLRRAQPEGPYWLAGYSFGGICAYEMARQLRADGHEVAFLGVVDVGPGYRGPGWHGSRSPFRPWFSVAKPPEPGTPPLQVLDHYRRMLAEQGPKRFARHFMVRSGIARLVDPWRFQADLRTHGRIRPEWRLWYAWEEHWKLAAKGWDRGATYPGRMRLFWGSESASADATMGWEPLVGELIIDRFAGDHIGVLEPRGAEHLAKVLRAAIDEELTHR